MSEWDKLRLEVANCIKCDLHKERRQAVLGEGPLSAEIMLIGEAPGAQEDLEGRPFVGAAGKLLNKMLEEAGLRRSDIYITNIVKCRPPGNREPTPDEEEACLPYLIRQIALVKPRLIITMGKHSTRALLHMSSVKINSISSIRGKPHNIRVGAIEAMVIPTYHPAAAIYNPSLRQTIVNDLRQASKLVKERTRSIMDFIEDKEHQWEQ